MAATSIRHQSHHDDIIYVNGMTSTMAQPAVTFGSNEDHHHQRKVQSVAPTFQLQHGVLTNKEQENDYTGKINISGGYHGIIMDELCAKPVSKLKQEMAMRSGSEIIVTSEGESDVTLEYMDLDEFLHENGLASAYRISDSNNCEKQYPVNLEHRMSPESSPSSTAPPPPLTQDHVQIISSQFQTPVTTLQKTSTVSTRPPSQRILTRGYNKKNSPSPTPSTSSTSSSDLIHERRFSEARSTPSPNKQPIILEDDSVPTSKRSRKELVPDDEKDDKYWMRRVKNNIAAKRSRDSRREREAMSNQRSQMLEVECSEMKKRLDEIEKQNTELKRRLSQYEGSTF